MIRTGEPRSCRLLTLLPLCPPSCWPCRGLHAIAEVGFAHLVPSGALNFGYTPIVATVGGVQSRVRLGGANDRNQKQGRAELLEECGADIVEPNLDLVPDIVIGGAGDQDAARLGEGFEARGDVDPVAKISSSPMIISPT